MEVLDELTGADAEIESAYNLLKEEMQKFAQNPLIKLIAGKELSLEEMMDMYEQYANSGEGGKDTKLVKQRLAQIFNYFVQVYPSKPKKELILENNLDRYPLTKLFKLIDEQIQYSKRHINKAILPHFRKLASGIITSMHMNKGILLTKVFLTMGAQYLIVDPVLDNLFPYGVMATKPPKHKA